MSRQASITPQPALSEMMFKVSGAHTLDEFRREAARHLSLTPAHLTTAQMQQSGWLLTYAVEEAAMREDRADIMRCLEWLRMMLDTVSARERENRRTPITDKLRQRISHVFRLRDDHAMLQFKAHRLHLDGHVGDSLACYARLQARTQQKPRQMNEHAARAYGDMLLGQCKALLASPETSGAAQACRQFLQSYLDLGLFKATRLHWNFLSVAVDGHRRGWLDLTTFIPAWRPDILQVGPSHQNEAAAALARLREILPQLRGDHLAVVEAFVADIENVPWGQPLVSPPRDQRDAR